jgi:hypothetical protein
LRFSAKLLSDNNNDNYNDDEDNEDVVITSASKNNDNHDLVFFAPVLVTIAAVDKGVIRPRRCLLTSTPSHRRRGGDLLNINRWLI